MKINDILKFEKENMPEFQWKFEKFLIVFLAVFIGGSFVALGVGLIIGFAFNGDGIYCFIPLFVWLVPLTVVTIMLVVKARKVRAGLREYYYQKLSSEFTDIDHKEAKQYLLDSGIITEQGFIIEKDEVFEDNVVSVLPFEKARVEFYASIWGGKFFLGIVAEGKNGELVDHQLDNYLYNFFRTNSIVSVHGKAFDLFCSDKKKFVELFVRYNDIVKVEKKLG